MTIKQWIKFIKYRILSFLKLIDISVIPKDTPYCYNIIDVNGPNIKVKVCPYFDTYKPDHSICYCVGFMGFDFCHYDQVKICDISMGVDFDD